MDNSQIAKVFYEIADLLELKGVEFKPRAYRKAAKNIDDFPESMSDLYKKAGLKSLREIPGVGEAIAEKIEELIKSGKLEYADQLKKKFPKGFVDLVNVPGMGPKKAAYLHKKLRINSIEQLEKAAKDGKLRDLEKFGEKTEANIIKNIRLLKKGRERMLLGHALPIAIHIKERISKLSEVKRIIVTGSIARMKETIGDVDILVSNGKPEKIMDFFTSLDDIDAVLSKGSTKSSILLHSGLQVDLRVITDDQFGSATQYFVGSKEHNVRMRQIAINKDMKLSEYGLFKIGKDGSEKKIAGVDEKEIYKTLGMQWIPYEMREDKGEIEAALNNRLPKIIDYDEVLSDFHIHTKYSDGTNTISEIAETCKTFGYECIAITDHFGNLKIANAMDEESIKKQWAEIKKVEERTGIRIFKGAEININKDGSLDAPESILKKLAVVVASLHSSLALSKDEMTKRFIKAIENKYKTIIGHPTSRSIGRRNPVDIDFDKVFESAKSNNVFLEINAQSDRMDLSDVNARKAKDFGVKLSLGTDSHSVNQLSTMKFAISQARRAWCEKKDVLNCWKLREVEK